MDNTILRQQMMTAFNEGELELLCADINALLAKDRVKVSISVDIVGGHGLENKIANLIQYLARRSLGEYLIHAIKEARPEMFAGRSLSPLLEQTLRLYLKKTFDDDQVAQLDQAGETDPERMTLLSQVFVDLDVEAMPKSPLVRRSALMPSAEGVTDTFFQNNEEPVSAMKCFLSENWSRFVLIGGPGQGKSTLGQYLVQVHRANLLGKLDDLKLKIQDELIKQQDFIPKISRVPFRIILKYFAQWLESTPKIDSIEAYIAELLQKDTSRTLLLNDIHEILRVNPSLIVFDGLDEVIEPGLRSQMLVIIRDFLSRAEQLAWNVQIVATTRPTGYNDQFDPSQFLRLQLQTMSKDKVLDYCRRWVYVKVSEQERKRVIDTIKECQQEEHTKALLTTPLQVTIVLLITKNGGRPPAQREALFNDYWGTIYRREKSKAKGFIRTEEHLLFELHAYLGYVLHCRATGENVQSLLLEADFKREVLAFLRQRDSRASDTAIEQKANGMVAEARERLVLLVEPQSGFFGFELRSLQEFFAAAFLAQSAADTKQRFERLRAIALLDHWHNVFLFFAGRVVRVFGGEAANILELVCRPIDRGEPDRLLKRGARLALDIVIDGAFAETRDLQYSAIEFALTALDAHITQASKFVAQLGRLPEDDREQIFKPLLVKKLETLNESKLATALDAYGRLFGWDLLLQSYLARLLTSRFSGHVQIALEIAFRCKADVTWLANQLSGEQKRLVNVDLANCLVRSWNDNPTYISDLIKAWKVDKERIQTLLTQISSPMYLLGRLGRHRYENNQSNVATVLEIREEKDQLIAMLSLTDVMSEAWQLSSAKHHLLSHTQFGDILFRRSPNDQKPMVEHVGDLEILSLRLRKLLERTNLNKYLKMSLWQVYWIVNRPSDMLVRKFLREIRPLRNWDMAGLSMVEMFSLLCPWPSLVLAVAIEAKRKHSLAWPILRQLSSDSDARLEKLIESALDSFFKRASKRQIEELMASGMFGRPLKLKLPSLEGEASRLGVSVTELVNPFLSWTIVSQRKRIIRLKDKELRYQFEYYREQVRLGEPVRWSPGFLDRQWPACNLDTIKVARNTLSLMLRPLSRGDSTYTGHVINLFLQLLKRDAVTKQDSLKLMVALSRLDEKPIRGWELTEVVRLVPANKLASLVRLTSHESKEVCQGACFLLAVFVKGAISHRGDLSDKLLASYKSVFDQALGSDLIRSKAKSQRVLGIMLLIPSNYQIEDEQKRLALLSHLAKCNDDEELQAWIEFIQHFQPPKGHYAGLIRMLGSVLERPDDFSSQILEAAAMRCEKLMNTSDSRIDQHADVLGLPTISIPAKPIPAKPAKLKPR